VLVLLLLFLSRTRYGLIVRAGVENRAMVESARHRVQRAFTLVSRSAGWRPVWAACWQVPITGTIDPSRGTSMLIFAFIVTVIGGLGSIGGSAVAAVLSRAPAVPQLLCGGRRG